MNVLIDNINNHTRDKKCLKINLKNDKEKVAELNVLMSEIQDVYHLLSVENESLSKKLNEVSRVK